MDELELVRLHEDGEHLVLGGPGGARFVLPITESLRAAVRRDRPHLEHLRAEGERNLSPREIQSRLRAGDDVDAVAAAAGLPVEHVRRFAGPVVAEQVYVVDQVRRSRQGHDDDAPTLDDLADRRLAARDVDPASVVWSAAREPGASWVVTAAFEVGSGPRTARWTFDPSSRALHALDDEARWLSQPEPAPEPAPGSGAVFDVDASPRRRSEPDGPTVDLLDDLGRRRGVRPRSDAARDLGDVGGQEPFEGFGPLSTPLDGAGRGGHEHSAGATVVHLPSIRPRDPDASPTRAEGTSGDATADAVTDSHADDARSGADAPADEPRSAEPPHRPAPRDTRKGKNRTRAKVPSWDDIVFGARPES